MEAKVGIFFILPTFALTFIFLFIPIIQSVRFSLFEKGLRKQTWVGLENYRNLFYSFSFWSELKISLIIAGLTVPLVIIFHFF